MRALFTLLLVMILAGSALAGELFATVDAVHGESYVLDASGKSTPATVGLKIFEGQSVGTRQDSELHLITVDDGLIGLRPNSLLRVDAYKAARSPDDKIHMSLLRGAMRSITGWLAKINKDAYRLQTQTATIGIRGTDHETYELEQQSGIHEPGTYERVNQGATVVRSTHHEIEVHAGETGFLSPTPEAVPRLLAKTPEFLDERPLRIEERLQRRRELIREATENLSDEQLQRLRETYREASPEQRERMRKRMQNRLRNRKD